MSAAPVDPLDSSDRTITAARIVAGWPLVLLPVAYGLVYVQMGDYVAYLSNQRALCELSEALLELRNLDERWQKKRHG